MRRTLGGLLVFLAVVVCLAPFAADARAQWLNHLPPGTPRTKDGRPDLTAPAPRTADGRPELSGVWMHEINSAEEIRRLFGPGIDDRIKVDVPGMEIGTQHKYAFDILLDYKAGELLRPQAVEGMRRRASDRDPANVCAGTPGIPRADLLSEPIKIVQAPRLTMVLYEAGNFHRQIYTDGRALPKEFSFPSYYGYSVGRWERDTLVVETAGFNDKTTLDGMGRPHTEALRVVERYHRRDFGHLDIETTFEDPAMYTRPFTIRVPHDLLPDADIFEMFCNENEKDREHLGKR